jgi:type II secretory pathway component PulK
MSPRPGHHAAKGRRRKGTILIVTLWIILALVALVLLLANAMRVEALDSAREASALKADAIEQGAIQYVLAHVDSLSGAVPTETDTPSQAVRVGDGAFWLLKPSYDDDRNWYFGVIDEASKINLNTPTSVVPDATFVNMLQTFPDVTAELAASIVDWRDPDSNVTPGGAESDYYMLLKDPYQCKNAPFETIDELFLVMGAARQVLYGEDTNRNGVLDPNEDDGDASDPPDNRDGQLDYGLLPFVTVYSVEPNTDANGQARINVTTGGRALTDLLRQNLSAGRAVEIAAAAARERRTPFLNIFDFQVRTGMTAAEFALVADRLTTSTQTTLRGLVNVNTAPKQVLMALPGLDDTDASALLAGRTQSGIDSTNVGWVASALTPAKAVLIGGLITARSYRFSADIVSLAQDGRAFRRCRVVIDAQNSPPKVIYRQDLTHLGWPLDPQILAHLRAGGSLDDLSPIAGVPTEVSR